MGILRLTDGHVLRPDGSIEAADVFISTDEGTIVSIGGEIGGVERELDAANSLVMPGLVNAHCHVAMTLLRGYADDKPLHTWLEEDIFPIEAVLEPADVAAGARLGALEMIKTGTTTFCDMYFHEEVIADATVESGLKALLGYGIITIGRDDDAIDAELDAALSFATEDTNTHARIKRGLMPHAIRTVDPSVLERVTALAAQHDLPVHLHCSETADDVAHVRDRDGRTPVGTAHAVGLTDTEAFIAHGVHLDDRDIDRLGVTETGVAHCPSANLKLASGMAPITALHDEGVTVGIGTDGPASNNDLDMFEEMRLAALIAKVQADDASALPAELALEMATRGGRSLLGFDGGIVAEGEPADLAVVDLSAPHFSPPHDLLSHLVYTAHGGDVRHTICDGQVLMRDREVLTLDEAAVRAAATEHAEAAIARAE